MGGQAVEAVDVRYRPFFHYLGEKGSRGLEKAGEMHGGKLEVFYDKLSFQLVFRLCKKR